jgi:DNA-binding NarL/FixJ family response regulator
MDLDRAAAAHQAALAKVNEIKQTYTEHLRAARAEVDATRTVLADAIVHAYEDGTKVGDIARRASYSRETVRVVLRNAGVEPE